MLYSNSTERTEGTVIAHKNVNANASLSKLSYNCSLGLLEFVFALESEVASHNFTRFFHNSLFLATVAFVAAATIHGYVFHVLKPVPLPAICNFEAQNLG